MWRKPWPTRFFGCLFGNDKCATLAQGGSKCLNISSNSIGAQSFCHPMNAALPILHAVHVQNSNKTNGATFTLANILLRLQDTPEPHAAPSLYSLLAQKNDRGSEWSRLIVFHALNGRKVELLMDCLELCRPTFGRGRLFSLFWRLSQSTTQQAVTDYPFSTQVCFERLGALSCTRW